MTKKLVLVFGIVTLGGMFLWASEDNDTLQDDKLSLSSNAQLQVSLPSEGQQPLTHGQPPAVEASVLTLVNEDGATVVYGGWQAETTAFNNMGDGIFTLSDFNGNGRVTIAALPTLLRNGELVNGTMGSVWVFDEAGEIYVGMDGRDGFWATGADIAENFSSTEVGIEPGSAMILDPDNPGSMKRSESAYDRRVAGVASGAENYKPGMTLGSRELVNRVPVTLTGTVYCKVSNANGPIETGDLLTTSDIPGHAMKATDATKSQGAILGKAMEGFTGESGLIMILAALQ